MSWVTVGVAGASAVMGAQQAKQKQKAEQAGMIANAEQIRYSPWTGMNANIQGPSGANDPTAAALQGGLGGAMMGQQFKSKAAAPAAPTPEPSAPMETASKPMDESWGLNAPSDPMQTDASQMGVANTQSQEFNPMGMNQMQNGYNVAANKKSFYK